MKWQDLNDQPLSSAAICRAVTDRSKNHNLDGPGLLKHHEEEALVLWAWNPGRRLDGTERTVPPLSHQEFVAATRAMLVSAAAERWKVASEQCRTEQSVVRGPGGQSIRYAELAADAARQPVPASVRLKSPTEFRLVGKRVPRIDSRPKCDGSLKFGLDLDLPGMRVAVVAHPPVFGARVKSVDDTQARGVEGVRDVFEIQLVKGRGIAVVADKFWPAKQARDRLKIEWDFSGVERADSSELWTRYKQLARTQGLSAAAR